MNDYTVNNIENNQRNTYDDFSESQEQNQINSLIVSSPQTDETSSLTITKVAQGVISLGIFGTTLYFGTQELIQKKEPHILYVCAIANGGAGIILFHTLLPKIARKARELLLRFSYEIQFYPSQIDMNKANRSTRVYTAGGWEWATGAFAAGDIYYTLTRLPSDSPSSSMPPSKETKLIPTLTLESILSARRGDPDLRIVFISLNVLRALIAEASYWSLHSYYPRKYDDLSNINFYGQMAHFYAGAEIGSAIARYFDDIREEAQTKFLIKQRRDSEAVPPRSLNWLNFARNSLSLGYYSSWLMPFHAVLVAPTNPLKLTDAKIAAISFFLTFQFAAIWGALELIERREFENPDAKEHIPEDGLNVQYLPDEEEEIRPLNGRACSSCSPACCWYYTKEIIYNYALAVIALLGMDSYFSAILGVEGWSNQIGFPILALLFFLQCSFFGTTIMRKKFKPSPDSNLICNELYFQASRPSLGAMIYQFLRVNFRMDDQQLKSNSLQLFLGAMAGWITWGLYYGMHLSLYMEKPPLYTPGMTLVEVNLRSAQAFIIPHNVTNGTRFP